MLTVLIVTIAVGFIVVERLWPASSLPKVRAWYARVALVNLLMAGIVVLAGVSWDLWLGRVSLFQLDGRLPDFGQGMVAYFVTTFVFYWWHRWRHESTWLWNIFHQLHHAPQRIEVLTSFYKHPMEISVNSILSGAIIYTLLGCSIEAGAWCTFVSAVAEFFYHWNLRTPRWLGFIIQRPESHRIHHRYRHHTLNFGDLPLWDWLFGTLDNARSYQKRCGYDPWREDRLEDMLVFKNINGREADGRPPLHFLPTCIGCSKRWACQESRESELVQR